jgi:hypothetical protein
MSEIRAIGTRTDNAQLMADCAELGYLPESVLDATYGTGRFWRDYHPGQLWRNDLDPESPAELHFDFRKLPFIDGKFAAVVFDPPYKLNGTSTGRGPSAADDGYGVGGEYSSVAAKMDLIYDGALECARVSSRYLLVKCQDQVVSGNVVWQTSDITRCLEWKFDPEKGLPVRTEWRLVDMLHVQGYRKQPESRKCPTCGGTGELWPRPEDRDGRAENDEPRACPDCENGRIPARQIHARRDYSTLLVFEK